MNDQDIRIDVETNSCFDIKMTVTDLSSGVSVSGSGYSSYKLKKKLLLELKHKINNSRKVKE